jgi:hypothetical protein
MASPNVRIAVVENTTNEALWDRHAGTRFDKYFWSPIAAAQCLLGCKVASACGIHARRLGKFRPNGRKMRDRDG